MQGSTVDSTKAELNYHGGHEAPAAPHEEHPDHRLFGFLVFLISESMLFVGLFLAYFAYRLVAPAWPPEGTPELETLLPGINTVILLSSSFVVHQADVAVKKNNVSGFAALVSSDDGDGGDLLSRPALRVQPPRVWLEV